MELEGKVGSVVDSSVHFKDFEKYGYEFIGTNLKLGRIKIGESKRNELLFEYKAKKS